VVLIDKRPHGFKTAKSPCSALFLTSIANNANACKNMKTTDHTNNTGQRQLAAFIRVISVIRGSIPHPACRAGFKTFVASTIATGSASPMHKQ